MSKSILQERVDFVREQGNPADFVAIGALTADNLRRAHLNPSSALNAAESVDPPLLREELDYYRKGVALVASFVEIGAVGQVSA